MEVVASQVPSSASTAPSKEAKDAESMLSDAWTSWHFDSLAFAEVTNNRPLSTLGVFLFDRHGLVDHFGLDRKKVVQFFEKIEAGHDDSIPYHNRKHVASVLHMTHAILQTGGVAEAAARGADGEEMSGQLEIMACLIAATIHDFEHLGLSNDFLMRTLHDRALLYNDRSVNEHHHLSAAFLLMRTPDCNFLEALSETDYKRFRALVVDLVLGTDMAVHGELMTQLSAAFDPVKQAEGDTGVVIASQDVDLVLQMVLKCADLGHLASAWDLHVQWVLRLQEESFAQGDREKALGLHPTSFLCDRSKPGAYETQVSFFDLFVLPLYKMLLRVAPSTALVYSGIVANYERWQDLAKLRCERQGRQGDDACCVTGVVHYLTLGGGAAISDAQGAKRLSPREAGGKHRRRLRLDSESSEEIRESEAGACASAASAVSSKFEDPKTVEALLSDAFYTWQFDAIALSEATGNRPLSTLAIYLFDRHRLVEHFKLDRDKLASFMERIEDGYCDSIQYHNRRHVASVLQATHAVLEMGGVKRAVGGKRSGRLELMACLLAAVVHDHEHKGLSNDFLVRTSHERALLYNDKHVNEHHHVATAFRLLLRNPEYNFLERLPHKDFVRLRSIVIELVLGTDMASHGQFMTSFNAAVLRGMASERGCFPETTQDAALLMNLALKCADLGHLSLAWIAHVKWVQKLEDESFAQGDREKALGLYPISFLRDRTKPGASDTQVGFFDLFVLPLFRTLVDAAPQAQPMLEGVVSNYERWKEVDAQKAKVKIESKPVVVKRRPLTSGSTKSFDLEVRSPERTCICHCVMPPYWTAAG